jgi:hypothetical protein
MNPDDLDIEIEKILRLIRLVEEFAGILFVLLVVSCAWIWWDADRRKLKIGVWGWVLIVGLWPFSVFGYPAWRSKQRARDDR